MKIELTTERYKERRGIQLLRMTLYICGCIILGFLFEFHKSLLFGVLFGLCIVFQLLLLLWVVVKNRIVLSSIDIQGKKVVVKYLEYSKEKSIDLNLEMLKVSVEQLNSNKPSVFRHNVSRLVLDFKEEKLSFSMQFDDVMKCYILLWEKMRFQIPKHVIWELKDGIDWFDEGWKNRIKSILE